MTRRRLLSGGVLLSAGNGFAAILGFLRNIAIARLVSVEDFGIVVLLSLTLSALETISNLAIDRLLVQAPDGNDEHLQATAHALQAVRGVFGGFIVFAAAAAIASLFKVPDATWAFQTLALVPIIRSVAHLDSVRIQREFQFRPTFWVLTLPPLLSLAVALPAAYALRNYSAIVWATLAQSLAHTAATHLMAKRPYRWAWDRSVAARILSFGWPLLANGLLMFVIFQGDKALVAVAFNPETVGWYGAAFMLSMAPAMMLTSVMQSLLLPLLSRVQHSPEEFALRYNQTVQASIGAGLLLATLFGILGPQLLTVFFGESFRAGSSVVVLLGLAQGVRVAKGGQFVCSVALAHTKDPLIGNLGRGMAFLVAIYLVGIDFGPVAVAGVGLLGEIAAYIIAASLLARRGHPTSNWNFAQVSASLILAACSVAIGMLLQEITSTLAQFALGLAWLFTTAVFYFSIAPAMRKVLESLLRGRVA